MSAEFSGKVQLERHALDNGLEVVLHRDTALPLIALNVWYHVGSKNEVPGRTGLAHLFEHMLFQGSQNIDANEHFRLVQQAGGVANGSTWFDRTNYYETLPSNQLDLGLWLESDRMGFLLPALDQEKLDNQQSVVINERRQQIDNQPYGRAFERLHELLYPAAHPYSWPVIGYVEDISAATLDDLKSFFCKYYAPNNAVLTLAGDFSIDHAIDRVNYWFGEIPAGDPFPQVAAEPTKNGTEIREEMEDRVELSRIYKAYALPGYGQREWYSADLLSTALSGGKSSPLYKDLVYTRQIATDVTTFVLPTELASTFFVVATAKPDSSLPEIEAILEDHLAEVAATPLPQGDLERARNKVVTAFCDELQKLDYLADLLSMFTTYFDDPNLLENELETYLDLDASELMDLAANYLTPEKAVNLAVVPESGEGSET